jgi:hypothetical protein
MRFAPRKSKSKSKKCKVAELATSPQVEWIRLLVSSKCRGDTTSPQRGGGAGVVSQRASWFL